MIAYTEIASLDPLSIDQYLHLISQDKPAKEKLRDVIDRCLELIKSIDHKWGVTESTAALRDLEFLIAKYVCISGDQNITSRIPDLEDILLRLGTVCRTIPRGTVYTYALFNPPGQRLRRFTDDQQEVIFIKSVFDSIIVFDHIFELLVDIQISDHMVMFKVLHEINDQLTNLIPKILSVYHAVSPDFFTYKMRPHFDPIFIRGNRYLGPGGSQLPLLILDNILWGSDLDDDRYHSFYNDNIPYIHPVYQELGRRSLEYLGGKSLVTYFSNHEAIKKTLKKVSITLNSFRYPHLKIAMQNFQLRSSDDVGSGNYQPDILKHIIDIMKGRLCQ